MIGTTQRTSLSVMSAAAFLTTFAIPAWTWATSCHRHRTSRHAAKPNLIYLAFRLPRLPRYLIAGSRRQLLCDRACLVVEDRRGVTPSVRQSTNPDEFQGLTRFVKTRQVIWKTGLKRMGILIEGSGNLDKPR